MNTSPFKAVIAATNTTAQSKNGRITRSVRAIRHALFVVLASAIAALTSPSVSQASFVVLPGYDLLHTEPGTIFAGVPFVGVPLGAFDFGGGPVPIGNTDTIVHRLTPAVLPGPGTAPPIPIEMVALQLVSALPVDFGLGTGFYYVTLQSARGGPISPGQMTITFGPEGIPHGAFDSFFDVFFDVRLGSLNGPIALSNDAILQSNGVPWSHFPPPGAVEITGVNTFLDGSDRLADFFPVGTFAEQHASPPIVHIVTTATVPAAVPEPNTLLLVVLAVVSLIGSGWRRRHAIAV